MTFFELIKACEVAPDQASVRYMLTNHSDKTAPELFRLMLCPSIQYNIKKIPEKYIPKGEVILNDQDMVERLHELLTKELRGKALHLEIDRIDNDCYFIEEGSSVLSWILARKNPAQIGKSMVNSVWPGLIRTQEYMGAVPGTDEALERLFRETPYVNVQEKIDGQTGLVEYLDGVPISMHTRQGNRIDQFFPKFMSRLARVPGFTGMVHHEILVRNLWKVLPRAEGNGLISTQIKNGKIGGGIDHSLCSVLLDTYSSVLPELTQSQRYHEMHWFVTENSKRVNQFLLGSLSDARKMAQKLIQEGGEGVVCKHPDMPFKDGKHWNNVKIKNEFVVDLKCVKTKRHSTRKDLLGALLMQTEDGLLEVWVNLKCEADRGLQPSEVLSAILRVKAESVTESKSKKVRSLYLPRFDGDCYLEYLHEKDTADTLEEVLEQERMSRSVSI